MKKYLFLSVLFLFACSKNQENQPAETEFIRVWGKVHSTGPLTFIEEDNNERFFLEIENKNFDPDLIRFKLGSHEFAFFESVDYEFDESRVGEMWLEGGGDCSGFYFQATKTFEDFGEIEKLKFEPEELFWDCAIYVEPRDAFPMTFEFFIRKKG